MKQIWLGFAVIGCLAIGSPVRGQQQPSVSRSGDSCGRADPAYFRIANETGGQPLFLKPTEVGQIGQHLRETSGNDRETLLWATDALTVGGRQFVVVADSTVQKLTLSLSVNREASVLTVTRPSGVAVRVGDPDVETTELACVKVITLTSPDPGEWRLEIRGQGNFWLQVGARTPLSLTGVEFVRGGGRPGHEGLFRINGQPLSGSPATLRATLHGPAQNAGFELVTLAGAVIAPIAMSLVSRHGDAREYVGAFDVPTEPFRVAVSGTAERGDRYQRVFHTLFHGETVAIEAMTSKAAELQAGSVTPATFEVRNIGQPRTFRIVAVDSRQYVRRVEPRELMLQTGASALVTVDLSVPADTPAGTTTAVTITVESVSGPTTSNGAVMTFAVP